MFAPARKGRISCAVKSNAKNLRGLGKERRLIFLWLVLFSRRGTGYEILTSSVYTEASEAVNAGDSTPAVSAAKNRSSVLLLATERERIR